ncbi:hypothetical protein BB559_001583 [Furculomyces boomerangus]|uniref:Uncharacterized protein n=2 Tax=Furculomyces boomerangus TaxID=61424 RepID=A0A2T9Z1E6_9FUNG|nr:hypothetical protein BB559_001583 [Furculomyces boomerangus]
MIFKLENNPLFLIISKAMIFIFAATLIFGISLIVAIKLYNEHGARAYLQTRKNPIYEEDPNNQREYLFFQFKNNNFANAFFGSKKITLFKHTFLVAISQLIKTGKVSSFSPSSYYLSPKSCGIMDSDTTQTKTLWKAFISSASIGKQWGGLVDDIQTSYTKTVCSWACTFADRSLSEMHKSQLEPNTLICVDTGKMLRENVLSSALSPLIDPNSTDFKSIVDAFTKLTDVSFWAIRLLGYLNMSITQTFLLWLMSSELQTVRNFVDSIMIKAGKDSNEYQLYCMNKTLLQDIVIHKIISFNSTTASQLITSFYDIATRPELRNSLREEQQMFAMNPNLIRSQDPLVDLDNSLNDTTNIHSQKIKDASFDSGVLIEDESEALLKDKESDTYNDSNSNTSILSDLGDLKPSIEKTKLNEHVIQDYPLNIPGAGRNLLNKCTIYRNRTEGINLLTLNLTRSLPLLNACIVESYRLCPPICSQIWMINDNINEGFTEETALMLSETSPLRRGDYVGLCLPAVYEGFNNKNVQSVPSVSESLQSSHHLDHDTDSDVVSSDFSVYQSFGPKDNWKSNLNSQKELLGVFGDDCSLTYDYIRVLLSHLLTRSDFSTFEWGKPEIRECFFIYTTLFNSSLMFKMLKKI